MLRSDRVVRPVLEGINFNRIREERIGCLEREFSTEEVKQALDSLEGDKEPSPDGFNFRFIETCWNTVTRFHEGVQRIL